ncbi:MAG: hypothetical protein KAG64_09415 [Bacteroidales bacterium]|nr:hypothetical protein [Bacteroidales bacterium]
MARWTYKLDFQQRKIRIDAIANHIAIPMIHHMILHPAIRFLSAQEGTLMLHAGAVSRNASTLVLSGTGGTGKTTTTSLLLASADHKWTPHSDDYVFITQEAISLPYMTRHHIYKPLTRWVPQISNRLTISERIWLQLFGILRSWSKDRIKWPLRVKTQQLWPNCKPAIRSQQTILLFFEKTNTLEPTICAVNPACFPIDALIDMNFHEARHFINLIRKHNNIVDVDLWFDNWRSRETMILKKIVKNTPTYILNIPKIIEVKLKNKTSAMLIKILNHTIHEIENKPSNNKNTKT